MRTVAIVQARMGSTRLPGKSAMLIQGKPLVWHVLNRVMQADVDEVCLALPHEPVDNTVLARAAYDLGVRSITTFSDANDLISRYFTAAAITNADICVRVPADNPCVDPDEINRILRVFSAKHPFFDVKTLFSNLDGNIGGNSYPGGLGAEVYSKEFLCWLHENVQDPRLREHPHLWAMERQRVATLHAHHEIARPELRFDVNTLDDFTFVKSIYDALYPSKPDFRIRDILKHLGEQNGQRTHLESNQG
jgi:spore coat polysaccharide biosynthesis protein SpsF